MLNIFGFFRRKNKWREYRRYPRQNTHNLVAIKLLEEEYFNLVDLSEGGMRYACPYPPLNRGELFTCRINLAEKQAEITALAKVVWNKPVTAADDGIYHVGVSFLSISEEACAAIRDFIHSGPVRTA